MLAPAFQNCMKRNVLIAGIRYAWQCGAGIWGDLQRDGTWTPDLKQLLLLCESRIKCNGIDLEVLPWQGKMSKQPKDTQPGTTSSELSGRPNIYLHDLSSQ